MNLPWIIELEIPSGVFSVSQLAEPLPKEKLNAEILASYNALREGPLKCVRPLPSTDNTDQGLLPTTSTLHLLLGHFHLEYVMIEICNTLSKLSFDPTQPWSDKEIEDMKAVFQRFYGNRALPDQE